jgi:thioesterase domain-containing protein
MARVFDEVNELDDVDPFGTVLCLKPTGDRAPLFCIHSGVGFSLPYIGLAPHIGTDHPIYGIQSPSITELAPMPESIEALAADYIVRIKRIRPEGPYHLLGWSFGGVLAHEIAVQLVEADEEVGLLANLDAYPPSEEDLRGDDQAMLGWIVELVGHDRSEFAGRALTPQDIVDVLRRDRNPLAGLGEDRVLAMLDVMRDHSRLSKAFVPSRFPGKMMLFRATVEGASESHVGRWAPYVGGCVEEHRIGCTHEDLMDAEPLTQISAAIAEELKRLYQAKSGDGAS